MPLIPLMCEDGLKGFQKERKKMMMHAFPLLVGFVAEIL